MGVSRPMLAPGCSAALGVPATLCILFIACSCNESTGYHRDTWTSDPPPVDTPWAECGNGRRDPDEVCDGTDIGGEDCHGHGFLGGALYCRPGCDGFIFDYCTGGCGNNVAEGPAQGLAEEEPCDGTDLRGHNCTVVGYELGEISCLADCSGFDDSRCRDPVCGDGTIEGSEDCEPDVPLSDDCIDLGFNDGVLMCTVCRYDTSECITWECGNGVLEGLEQCDVDVFRDDETCESLGHSGGELSCFGPETDMPCMFDTSTCTG